MQDDEPRDDRIRRRNGGDDVSGHLCEVYELPGIGGGHGGRHAFYFPSALARDAIGDGPEVGGSSHEVERVVVVLVERDRILSCSQPRS